MRLSGRGSSVCGAAARCFPASISSRLRRGAGRDRPNGSGKTSLLRLIAGLLHPAGGSIALEGGEAELTLAEQAHYLGHRDALKPALSVTENLRSGAISSAASRRRRAKPAAVGLGHATHLPAAFLSAGQRRRLSIARLLACGGRSGCWTSRPRRSMPQARRCSPA
jgi:heme exporter protein A